MVITVKLILSHYLWDGFSKLNQNKERLKAENKGVLSLETEISHLKITNGSIVGSLLKVNARAVEIKRDLKKAQTTIAVACSC